MIMNMLDYDVLVRQKRDAMLADAERQRMVAQRANDETQRLSFRALVATLRGRANAPDNAPDRKAATAPAA